MLEWYGFCAFLVAGGAFMIWNRNDASKRRLRDMDDVVDLVSNIGPHRSIYPVIGGVMFIVAGLVLALLELFLGNP